MPLPPGFKANLSTLFPVRVPFLPSLGLCKHGGSALPSAFTCSEFGKARSKGMSSVASAGTCRRRATPAPGLLRANPGAQGGLHALPSRASTW